MLQAATNLGLAQTLPALRALQQQTGLDELTIRTGSSSDSAALVGGKYLNPDLYLSYAQGLFDPQGTLSLKYRLNDKLSIETRSGSAQSIDLIYSFERD